MLRTCLGQGEYNLRCYGAVITSRCLAVSRSIASSSSKCSALHTSTSVRAGAPLTMKDRREKRAERARKIEETRPHAVLGTRRGDDAKWLNCDLAKILVTEEELDGAHPQPLTLSSGVLWMPRLLNYGVGEAEKELLFEHLPPLTTEVGGIRRPKAWTITMHEEAEQTELKKANMLASVIDLRNANAGGIAYENRRRIVAAFSEPGKPGDTGRSEVQGMQHGLPCLPYFI
jgi:small subunit ribosomal protein S15